MVSRVWFFLWIPFKETAGNGTVVGLSINGAFGRLSLGLLTGRSLVESTLTSCVKLVKHCIWEKPRMTYSICGDCNGEGEDLKTGKSEHCLNYW